MAERSAGVGQQDKLRMPTLGARSYFDGGEELCVALGPDGPDAIGSFGGADLLLGAFHMNREIPDASGRRRTIPEMISPAFPVGVRLAAIPQPSATNSRIVKRTPQMAKGGCCWSFGFTKMTTRTARHPGKTTP